MAIDATAAIRGASLGAERDPGNMIPAQVKQQVAELFAEIGKRHQKNLGPTIENAQKLEKEQTVARDGHDQAVEPDGKAPGLEIEEPGQGMSAAAKAQVAGLMQYEQHVDLMLRQDGITEPMAGLDAKTDALNLPEQAKQECGMIGENMLANFLVPNAEPVSRADNFAPCSPAMAQGHAQQKMAQQQEQIAHG